MICNCLNKEDETPCPAHGQDKLPDWVLKMMEVPVVDPSHTFQIKLQEPHCLCQEGVLGSYMSCPLHKFPPQDNTIWHWQVEKPLYENKPLDEEDILSLGWEKMKDGTFDKGLYGLTLHDKGILLLNMLDNDEGGFENIDFTLKNKSDLQTLMRFLGI